MNYLDRFFNTLIAIAGEAQFDPEAVKQHALSFAGMWSPSDFNVFDDKYVRTSIGRGEAVLPWEALVLSWKKGNTTEIHGHPDFASYTGLSGEILVELFELQSNGKCKKVSEILLNEGVSFYAQGKKGCFDNHIHRLTCLSETAHSLHIYSDDALKGVVFEEEI